jgi:metal-responsive CopG/Arc/MetJ family transcriptional regulator
MAENLTSNSTERIQVNVRVDGDLIKLLDEKRIELLKDLGSIPSRSEVIRMALEAYLTRVQKT